MLADDRPAPSVDIVTIESAEDPLLPAFRQLVRDFLAELGESLDYQGVEEELAALPGKYSRSQRGCMYIAVDRSTQPASPPLPVGCIGLRQLDTSTGEVKRMYVAPSHRGHGVAGRLLAAVVRQAAAPPLHYAAVRLDTLARLQAANALYRRTGFYPIAAYNDCPIEGALWFELDLTAHAANGTSKAAVGTSDSEETSTGV